MNSRGLRTLRTAMADAGLRAIMRQPEREQKAWSWSRVRRWTCSTKGDRKNIAA